MTGDAADHAVPPVSWRATSGRVTVEIVAEHQSPSNRRYVMRLDDGALVESVLYRGDTLCVSSQVGCAVGCPFCASGARGFGRNLSLDELVGQVEAITAQHAIERATVSGIGEPLHNHQTVLEFIDWCRARRIGPSLTTSGGPLSRLRQWIHAHHNGLTISVHSGTEATRARAVPRGPALDELFATLAEELPRATSSRRKKIALAYLLIEGLNDSDAEIDAFIERAQPLRVMVHLYDHNAVPTSALHGVRADRYADIYARMTASGMRVRMSSKARLEANGGCGTLVAVRRERTALPLVR